MNGKIVLHREIQKKVEILELEKYNVSNKKIFLGGLNSRMQMIKES